MATSLVPTGRRFLLVIDFDNTISEKNTDDWILKYLLPKEKVEAIFSEWYSRKFPWHQLMKNGFQALHEEKVSRDKILNVIGDIPMVKGFDKFIELVGSHTECQIIIASDSNAVFIDTILKKHGLEKYIDQIFTNPAHFDSEGHLQLYPHHSHSCPTCCPNICKQEILRLHLEREGENGHRYERIFVIGDGNNDFCPCKLLEEKDCIFPRNGFHLVKKLDELRGADEEETVKASVVPWEDGDDLFAAFRQVTGLVLE